MSQIHQKLLTTYEGELKLPSSPLVFIDHRSNKLLLIVADQEKISLACEHWRRTFGGLIYTKKLNTKEKVVPSV